MYNLKNEGVFMRKFISVITSVLLAVSVLFPVAGGITAFAEESANLTLDEVVSLTPKSEGQTSYRTFLFTPESTGAYKCRAFDGSGNTIGYVNVYTYTDGIYNHVEQNELYQNAQTRFSAFYLQAGVEYQIRVQFGESCSFVLTGCELAKDFIIFMDGSSVGSEYTAYAGLSSYIHFQQSHSMAYIGRLAYSFSDPGVAAFSEQSNSVKFLKAGETDMTVSTVFGLTKTVHITVNEPPVLEYGTAAEVQTGNYAFSFTAPDDGLFGILADSQYGIMYIFHDNEKVASYQRTVSGVMSQYEMKAGERYVISGQYSGGQSGKIEVIKPTKAESLSLITTDGDYLTDFSCNAGTRIYAYTSFGPGNAAFEDVRLISNSNEEVVKTEMYSANEVCFVSVKAGVAVLKFQSDNGLEVSVTVTVSEPVSLTEDQPLTVTYNAKHQGERVFSFTPAEDGNYVVKADNFSEFESGYINFRITDGTNTIGEAFCDGKQPAKLSAGNLQKNKTYTIFCDMRGYTNSVGLSDSSSFDLTVSKGVAVSSLELLTPPDIKYLYEGEQPGSFFGLSVRINYTDGPSDIWKYDEGIYDIGGFKINVSYSGPGHNEPYVTVSCSGKSVTFYYEVRECDIAAIEHIEYEKLIYDASYTYNSFHQDITGDCFKVIYKNGRVEYKVLMQGDGGYWGFLFRDLATGLKESVVISSSQTYSDTLHTSVWDIGTENYISVNYRGFECRILVTVINAESLHITKIEPVNGAAIRFTENSHGYNGGSGNYIYSINYDDLSDITVDITYGNGERIDRNIPLNKSYNGILFNYYSFQQQQEETPWLPGQNNYLKINYGGFEFNVPVIIEKENDFIKSAEVIEQPVYRYGDRNSGNFYKGVYYFYPQMRDGFKIKLTYNDDNNTEVILDSSMLDSEGRINGKNIYFELKNGHMTEYSESVDMFLNYGNIRVPFTLKLEKPVVAGLTVKKAPSAPKYGFMSPDFIGTEIEITYSDNNKKTVIFDNQNTYIDSDTGGVAVNTDDGIVLAEYDDYDNSYQFTFRDAAVTGEAIGTPEYDSNSVSGIEFVNETRDIIGSVIRISFNDGKSTALTLNDAAGTFDTQGWGIAFTEYGYLRFSCATYGDYSLHLGYLQYSPKSSFSLIAGDMNGDGSVDIMDMVCLKKYFAGTADICKRNADVTVDGSVSAEDMAELKKFLLGATRLTTKEGDMNCDGRFDKADLKLLSAYLAGNNIMLPKIADVNGDGVIDKNDFYALKQKYSEYIGY